MNENITEWRFKFLKLLLKQTGEKYKRGKLNCACKQTNITKKKHVIAFKSNVDETNIKGKNLRNLQFTSKD